MKKKILFLGIVSSLLFWAQLAHGQSISITEISPSSPSTLNFGEDVTINFEYTLNRRGGFRIFIRPFTSGRLTPNYAASGSPNYTSMRGRGSAQFSVTKGTITTVDQLRVQVVDTRQGSTIFEFFVPVDFTFGQTMTYTPILPEIYTIPDSAPKQLNVVPEELPNIVPPDTTEEIVVEKRTVKPNGTIELYYSDGSVEGIISNRSRYYVNPATGDTSYTQLFFSEVQGAHEPADPPGMATNTATNVNQEWLESLNAWIDYFGYQLLSKIKSSLEEQAFENYQQFEENNSSNIYEQVNLRYTFLEKLRLSDI